jgi:hypothetical protein
MTHIQNCMRVGAERRQERADQMPERGSTLVKIASEFITHSHSMIPL